MIIIPYYCYGARMLLIACCKYTRMDRLLAHFYRLTKQIEIEVLIYRKGGKFFFLFSYGKKYFLRLLRDLLFVLTRRRFTSR